MFKSKKIILGALIGALALSSTMIIANANNTEENPYDLVCLDIMMPVMDGYQALVGIRNIEKERNIPDEKATKVIMATALNDEKNVKMAFELGCTIYSGKPIDQERFDQALKKLGLIEG